MKNYTDSEKDALILAWQPIDEVASILGYYDGSNEDMETVTADEGTEEWVKQILEAARSNGNFEHLWVEELKP